MLGVVDSKGLVSTSIKDKTMKRGNDAALTSLPLLG